MKFTETDKTIRQYFLTQADKNAIVNEYKSGTPAYVIAKKWGFNHSSNVHKLLRKMKVPHYKELGFSRAHSLEQIRKYNEEHNNAHSNIHFATDHNDTNGNIPVHSGEFSARYANRNEREDKDIRQLVEQSIESLVRRQARSLILQMLAEIESKGL